MRIINDLNFKKQAEELGVSVWQAPSLLFLIMGIIIIIAMTATYYVSKNYDNPEILIIAESIVIITILSIGNSVIRGVEQIARLNKMKSEFVSVASHQLRTPLASIRWQIELLLSKFGQGLNEKQRSYIETVNQLSARMTRLVSDLLDVARIDQGRMILKKEKVDLAQVVRETINDLFVLAQAKNISIAFDAAKDCPPVVGDREKLRLVVENLVSNAIKYTLECGKVRINIGEKNKQLVFSISDNGVGIPQNQQSQVFNKFFRSDNVAKYQTEGTGLGLYIAKNILEQSGGKIWFESKENEGTTFYFSLPVNHLI